MYTIPIVSVKPEKTARAKYRRDGDQIACRWMLIAGLESQTRQLCVCDVCTHVTCDAWLASTNQLLTLDTYRSSSLRQPSLVRLKTNGSGPNQLSCHGSTELWRGRLHSAYPGMLAAPLPFRPCRALAQTLGTRCWLPYSLNPSSYSAMTCDFRVGHRLDSVLDSSEGASRTRAHVQLHKYRKYANGLPICNWCVYLD